MKQTLSKIALAVVVLIGTALSCKSQEPMYVIDSCNRQYISSEFLDTAKLYYTGNLVFGELINVKSATLTISNENGKHLYIDLRGDSLQITGDMPYGDAAKRFFDFVDSYASTKIDSLKTIIEQLQLKCP